MCTAGACPSSNKGWEPVSSRKVLISSPFAAYVIACPKTQKFYCSISLSVRGTLKIQCPLLSRIIFMCIKKMELLWQYERVMNLQRWPTARKLGLFSITLEVTLGKIAAASLKLHTAQPPPSSPCPKDSPRVRKKNIILECFSSSLAIAGKTQKISIDKLAHEPLKA